MIVILSYDEYEQGTDPVIDWLLFLKAEFIKITMKDFFRKDGNCHLDINNSKLYINNVDITDDVKVIFYRRLHTGVSLNDPNTIFKEQVESELTNEIHALISHLMYIFRNKVWLPPPQVNSVNKLNIVRQAENFGINPPKSIVTNNKKDLMLFFKVCKGKVITKPIHKSSYFVVDRKTYFAHVNPISKREIATYPERFFPSLFQEQIDKDFEIRCFYLDGAFYSVAMLLSGPPLGIDIKKNFESEHAHWVIYQLPKQFEEKIDSFMKSINLNTGSMDIIKTKNGDYHFIEVNPVGQYNASAYFSNYRLDKIIAEWLISKDKV